MKLLVSQHVNKRAGKPGTTGQLAGYVSPGDTVEVNAVVYGDVVDGNYLWYKSADGFYYWSGGFYNINFQLDDCKLADFPADQQMAILLMVLKEAESILKKDVKGYVGCGIGNKNFDEGEELSLLVYVKKKVDAADLSVTVLPEIHYRGIRILTDVLEVGTFSHNVLISKRDMESDIPLHIGGGISPKKDMSTFGTRSLSVRRKNGNTFDHFLLTCYHVLLSDLFPLSPYKGDFRQAFFPIGRGSTDAHIVAEGEYSSKYDYAAVRLSRALLNEEESITIREHVPFSELSALKGTTVVMIGYVSGMNEGKVLSLSNNVEIGPHRQKFNEIILTEKISVGGDSGAPVVEKRTNRLIGFIIGGNDDCSAVLPCYNLFLNRDFEINT